MRWTASLTSALVLAVGCASAPPAAPDGALRYALRYDGSGLEVEVELPADAPRRWHVADWQGRPRQVVCEPGGALPIADGEVALPPGARVVRYRYPFDHDAGFKGGVGGHGGHLVAGARYLLKPVGLRRTRPVVVRADPQALLPWTLDQGEARLRGADLLWTGFHTFGARRRTLTHAQGSLELAILPGGDPGDDDRLAAWIRTAWEELLTCAPTFPAKRLAVTLVPVRGSRRIGFGQLLHSRPPTIAIEVGTAVGDETLREDWVAVHELSHALHPRFEPHTPWLSEGLATYWQVVARIRSGRFTPARGWQHLAWGVRTGRRRAGGRSLEQLSARMHQWHAYRAVYWGGTLVALELDLAIRQASDGARSLDDALAALRAGGRPASLDALAAAVDAAAGRPVYAEVTQALLRGGPALADGPQRLKALGIVEGDGLARLDDAAPGAALRRALEGVDPGLERN